MKVKDLFREFNENKAAGKYENILVLGPPRSGKTFFINKYLKLQKAEEYTIGLIRHVQPSNKIIDIFKRVMPWVSRLNYIIIEEDKRLKKFGNEFVQSLKEMLGDKAPQHIINEIIERAKESNTNSIITYYIPWDYTGKIDEETKEALDLIIKTFKSHNAKIRWIKAEYIPPGLVREVVELIKTEGKNKAEETVNEWVDAYITVLKIAGLDRGEWEESFVTSARTFFSTLGVKGILEYITGSIMLEAVVTTIITLLTFHTFKTPQRAGVDDLIVLTTKLAKLKAPKSSNEPCGEFNELGKLIAYKLATALGLNVEEVCYALTKISGIDENELRSMIEDIYKRLAQVEKELREVKEQVEGSLVGAKVFFINEVENGLLYGNFVVEDGVAKIKTRIGTAREELVMDLVDAGKFHDVVKDVFGKLTEKGRVLLVGPRGIGKSTLAAYVIWNSLIGGLSDIILDKPRDAVICIDSLSFAGAEKINNLMKATSRRFVIIYDPSPIEAYIEPEAMKEARYDIKNVTNTLKALQVMDTWVIMVLPQELYDVISKDEKLKSALANVESSKVDVNLRDENFLRGIIKSYSGCQVVPEELVNIIMQQYSGGYTLIAKYAGIWLRNKNCEVEDVVEALNVSEPKLFFAHYIWDVVLRGSMNLAMKVSVPLMLHAAYGAIPEGITYITKAANDKGGWGLVDKNSLENIQLPDLKEEDLEPIVKWLSIKHEDLVEEVLEELAGLHGENEKEKYIKNGLESLVNSLKWGYDKVLKELEDIKGLKREKVWENLILFIGERLKLALKPLSNNCWKRAALIIGYGLTERFLLPRAGDLPEDVVKLLGDAFKTCGIDDYLLVDNEIPYLVHGLFVYDLAMLLNISDSSPFTRIFTNKYKNTVEEAKKLLEIWRKREGEVHEFEGCYALGLASIIADAARLGKDVSTDDADMTLYIAHPAIQLSTSTFRIRLTLHALKPLLDMAPHRYLGLLRQTSAVEFLDRETARLVFNELNYILDKHYDKVKKHTWSLVHAVFAYSELFNKHLSYLDNKMVEEIVGRVAELLRELGDTVLGTIAWAYALAPVLKHEHIRMLWEMKFKERGLHIDVIKKADYVLNKLNKLRENVKELLEDKEFVSYVESFSIEANEKMANRIILGSLLGLESELAQYKFDKDELNEAAGLFEKVANGYKEIGVFENYLFNHVWVLRVKAIEDSLASNDLVKEYDQLFNEAWNNYKPTANYLYAISVILYNYLVSLALTSNTNKAGELLKEYWAILNVNKKHSVMPRLILNTLLSSKNGLDDRLKDMLMVGPKELIEVFEEGMFNKFLPALKVAYGLVKPEDGIRECEKLDENQAKIDCEVAVLTGGGRGDAIKVARGSLISVFWELILKKEKRDLLKELGVDDNELLSMFNKFMELVYGLDGRSLVQLIAHRSSLAHLALMLYALINGNHELVKAHALYGTTISSYKLLTRLFLEAYKACCDLSGENFRKALARLFFYHV
jgi:energy-coupling factor transporter ATP-binding protein EcfA2